MNESEVGVAPENTCMEYHSQWQERLGHRLFPGKWCGHPDMDEAHDCLVIRTEIHLSFIDRLKLLFSGIVRVETRTTCENIIGSNVTNSVGYVAPPQCLQRKDE